MLYRGILIYRKRAITRESSGYYPGKAVPDEKNCEAALKALLSKAVKLENVAVP